MDPDQPEWNYMLGLQKMIYTLYTYVTVTHSNDVCIHSIYRTFQCVIKALSLSPGIWITGLDIPQYSILIVGFQFVNKTCIHSGKSTKMIMKYLYIISLIIVK